MLVFMLLSDIQVADGKDKRCACDPSASKRYAPLRQVRGPAACGMINAVDMVHRCVSFAA